MSNRIMNTSNISIAGAGLMGSLLAWRLARNGICVHVYEEAPENDPACAGWTAAAMVAPWAERPVCDDEVFRLGLKSLDLWPLLLQQLQQETGETLLYSQQGSLVVAHPADQAELEQFSREMTHYGLSQSDQMTELKPGQLTQMEPGLNSQLQQGFWLPQETHVDNRHLLPLLHQAARNAGAELHFNHPVADIPADGFWLDCRGTGAASSLTGLRGVRGEVLRIDSDDVSISRPVRLLHPRYHLYLVPKGISKGRYQYVLGATEIESDDRSPVSVRSALEMLSALYCLSPGLAEARIHSFDVNLRPALAHHRPEITPLSAGLHGLSINGLFRHGYLLAPALLQQLQDDWQLPLGLNSDNKQKNGGELCA